MDAVTWQMVALNLGTALAGGGAVWAYLTRRRETDAERVARYEGRLDARLESVERDRDAARVALAELDKRLAVTQHQLDDALEERDAARAESAELRVQNRLLIELCVRAGVEIPADLVRGYKPPAPAIAAPISGEGST